MPRFALFFPILVSVLLFLAGCSSTPPYQYHYVQGKTAVLRGRHAVAPESAPAEVCAAIAAGNRIAGLPYRYGSGHGLDKDTISDAYDCSGAASYILRSAGLLETPISSREFRNYGTYGRGKWMSVYARNGHVFMVVAGLRFDTGYGRGASGPQWTTNSRPATGCVIRHPLGL